MPNNSPTIVAAALSDQTLTDSIKKLVDEVNDSVNKMAENFNTAIGSMEAKLKSLGATKIDFGGTSGSGTKKVVSDQKELDAVVNKTTQSLEKQNLTLDQQSASLRSAMKGAVDDASNSYENLVKQIQQQAQLMDMRYTVTPIQELRMRQHELEAGIRSASDNAAKAKKDVDELDAAIANYRRTMESLPKDPQGFANRQAIQKEINDLTVLRDVAVSEQKQWTSAVARLSAEYSSVNTEINKVGQALIDEEQKEKKVTSELDRQLQKISEISSRKEATLALKSISSMEAGDLDNAEAKLANLKALKERVKNTDLMSQKGMQELDSWIKYTTLLVERFAEKTSRGAKEDEDAIRKAAEAEKLWADKVRQRGQVAQETSRKIIQMLNDEAQAGGKGLMGFYKVDGKDINAVRELEDAIKSMQQQYNLMTDTEKESAIGRVLKRDIENAKAAAGAISAYNKAASGMESNTRDVGAKSVVNYEILKNVLKELTQQYQNMSIAEIKAGSANVIVDKLQRTNRELQELQNRMNRPISLEAALKGSERTLDDIAYKMQRLQLYRQGIDLTKPNADQEIAKVDQKLQELQRDADKWMSKSKSMIEQNNALGRSWNYMKNRLAFYFTVGAGTAFVKNLIEVRSQYEMNERALGILIDSAERGTQIFNELSQMALVSPYTLIELSAAAKQLTAYDIEANKVVETTRRLADMAAAVGIPIERLTYALGQIKAYGYLNSRDARMFANAGIPLVKQLSEYYTELEGKLVSTADVYDRIKKKAIDYNDVMVVVNKMTDEGGKFFDFQAKMADTLKVQLANLNLAWNNMLNEIGSSQQSVLTLSIKGLKEMFLQWKNIEKTVSSLVIGFSAFKALQLIVLALARNIRVLRTSLEEANVKLEYSSVLGKKATGTFQKLGATIKGIAANPLTWWTLAISMVAELGITAYQANEAIKELNKSIVSSANERLDSINKTITELQSLYKIQTGENGNTTRLSGIDEKDLKKVWESIRNEIEMTSSTSSELILKLEGINDVNKRIAQGFDYLRDVQRAQAALSQIDDKDILVEQDWSGWWNLYHLQDGLIQNFKDMQKEAQGTENEIADIGKRLLQTFSITGAIPATISMLFGDRVGDFLVGTDLERYQKDLQKTVDSITNTMQKFNVEGVNAQNEFFNASMDKILENTDLTEKERLKIRIDAQEQFYNYEVQRRKNEIERESGDYKVALQKELDDYISYHEQRNGYVVGFEKWLQKTQITMLQETFGKMSKEEISRLDFSKGTWNKWVEDLARKFAEQNNLSIDEVFRNLRNYVNQDWTVYINTVLRKPDEKTVYETLEKADKDADEAWKKMQRLNKEISRLKKKGAVAPENLGIAADESLMSEDDRNLAKAIKEKADAQKDYNDAVAAGGHSKKEDAAGSKAQKAAESELQKALKEELKLIDEVRSQYKKLTDAGVSRSVAMKTVTEQFGESIEHINAVLRKNGLPEFNIKTFAGTDNPHEMMVMLKKQIDAAKKVKNIKPEEINELEIKYSKIKVDAEAYDATKIKKGLDNELGRLKDEYELAVELDADPELGGIFADMFDIDLDTLPRTAKEYAEMYTKSLNRYFKEMGKDIELPNMLNLTRDDMAEFQRQMEDDKLEKVYFELIQKGYEATQEARKKETTDTIKEWNALMDKYGGLQNNLLRITKDTTKEIVGVIRKFGTDDEIRQALDLSDRISISQDPEEIARLQEQLRPIVDAVAKRNPIALNVITSSQRGEKEKSAKEYWEDFKNSELYSMTFENMANNSTIAIETILSKLEELKEKVKEDPASMKALMKSIQDARSELESRDPFKAMADGSVRLRKALTEQKTAFEELEAANRRVEGAKVAVRNAEATGSVEELEAANEKLNDALNEQDAANKKVVKSSNSVTAAREKIIKGLKGLSENLNQIKGLFDTVSQLFRDAGDDDTADAIDGISKGFTVMTTVIMGVVAAMELLKDSQAWLLAISAALAVVVGLTSWLNSSNNKKIDRQIKDSEISVKRLENAYKNLQVAVDNAYGAAKYGAQQAAIANKKLQLAELERQLELEKSRSSKNRDASKIEDLRGQIIDLRNEINKASEDIINDMLGISSVGSAAEELVSSMIEAFRNGEDYMAQYDESFEKMIDNMIMKAIVGKVIGDRLEEIWNSVNDIAKSRGEKSEKKINDITEYYEKELGDAQDNLDKWTRYLGYTGVDKDEARRNIEYYKKLIKSLESNYEKEMADAQREYTEAIRPQPEDINAVRDDVAAWRDGVKQDFEAYMDAFGIKFGENAEDKGLSSLQQGIQGVTEETASALEAYMNGVSQQVYLHTELLTQIRDAVINITGGDLETGIQAQMLFQLQQSYTVQMAIQNILENAVSPNGQSFRVELVS